MTDALDRLFSKFSRNPKARNALMAIEAPRRGLSWRGAAPHLAPGTPFFIASCTKLFTTALIVQLVEQEHIDLDAAAARYLPEGTMDGLHAMGGMDRSDTVTVRHLISNRSGIGDYFEEDWPDGPSIFKRILAGEDPVWTRAQALEAVRRGKGAKFLPGAPGKAFYSDTNWQLAGAVLEAVTGSDYAKLVRERICAPLGLRATFVFTPAEAGRYGDIAPLSLDTRVLHLPRAMAAFGPDGSVVSTLDEAIAFLKGFFSGALFDKAWIARMQDWAPVFFPFRYGLGMMRFALPRILNPFRPVPPVIGHGGASGALMFHCPERDIYVAGSVNQIAARGLPYQFMLRALAKLG